VIAHFANIGPLPFPDLSRFRTCPVSVSQTSTTYDWLGRTTSTTDQRAVTHTYTYDSAGRLEERKRDRSD